MMGPRCFPRAIEDLPDVTAWLFPPRLGKRLGFHDFRQGVLWQYGPQNVLEPMPPGVCAQH